VWNDPQRKKTLIPVMFEKGYKADGWLGIIMGTKLYYNMHNQDEIERSLPGLVGEVEAAHGVDAGKLDGLKLGGGGGSGGGGGGGGGGGAAAAAPARAEKKRAEESVPQTADTMAMWLEGRGLARYSTAFREQHLHGKALVKFHEEIGFGDPAEGAHHELLVNVFGMTSYGHRLLFLAELEELLGPIRWRRR
jgi:hypothetical protein